jgi:hypothetical protein
VRGPEISQINAYGSVAIIMCMYNESCKNARIRFVFIFGIS